MFFTGPQITTFTEQASTFHLTSINEYSPLNGSFSFFFFNGLFLRILEL